MRLGEYLPWIIATAATLLFVTVVLPDRWSTRRKNAFKFVIAGIFFLFIGAYWLTTGEKLDETAYRFVLCKIYNFEKCVSIERTQQHDVSQQFAREAEALRKIVEEIRSQQQEAAARQAKEDRERIEKQRAADEVRRQEEAKAKAKADAEAVHQDLAQREAVGDTAMENAFRFWRQGNFKVAAEYSEGAIKTFSALPNSNDKRIRGKIAEAHAIVGLGLALLGATPQNQAYGCERLNTAKKIYSEIGNTPMVSRTNQELQQGRCRVN